MSLIEQVQSLLEGAGYQTYIHLSKSSAIWFEDPNIFGLVCEYETVAELLTSWESDQDSIFRENVVSLTRLPEKAWNAYAVYVTSERAAEEELAALMDIEEDFYATRKIARSGLATAENVVAAILPLLEIRHSGALGTVSADWKARWSGEREMLAWLGSGMDAKEVARRLLEDDEN
jgi:hypothetical protein